MKVRNGILIALCGCLLVGCGSSNTTESVEKTDTKEVIQEETTPKLEEKKEEGKKESEHNSSTTQKPEQKKDESKKESEQKKPQKGNQPQQNSSTQSKTENKKPEKNTSSKTLSKETLEKMAREALKSYGYTDELTLTGIYEGGYDGVAQCYQIGFISDTHYALSLYYYTENALLDKNSFDEPWKLSHHVNGVCGPEPCGGSDLFYYASAGEVNAAIISSRQAYEWKVIYEKEEPDFEAFRNPVELQEKVKTENEASKQDFSLQNAAFTMEDDGFISDMIFKENGTFFVGSNRIVTSRSGTYTVENNKITILFDCEGTQGYLDPSFTGKAVLEYDTKNDWIKVLEDPTNSFAFEIYQRDSYYEAEDEQKIYDSISGEWSIQGEPESKNHTIGVRIENGFIHWVNLKDNTIEKTERILEYELGQDKIQILFGYSKYVFEIRNNEAKQASYYEYANKEEFIPVDDTWLDAPMDRWTPVEGNNIKH